MTITSQPKFLGLIGYHISLAMELRWRALPAGSAVKNRCPAFVRFDLDSPLAGTSCVIINAFLDFN